MLPFVARSKCTYSSTMKVGNTKCTCKTCTRKKESMLLAMVVISGCNRRRRRRRRLAEQLWSSMWENTHNQVEQKFPAKKIPLKLMSFENPSTVLGEGVGGGGGIKNHIQSSLSPPIQNIVFAKFHPENPNSEIWHIFPINLEISSHMYFVNIFNLSLVTIPSVNVSNGMLGAVTM